MLFKFGTRTECVASRALVLDHQVQIFPPSQTDVRRVLAMHNNSEQAVTKFGWRRNGLSVILTENEADIPDGDSQSVEGLS